MQKSMAFTQKAVKKRVPADSENFRNRNFGFRSHWISSLFDYEGVLKNTKFLNTFYPSEYYES